MSHFSALHDLSSLAASLSPLSPPPPAQPMSIPLPSQQHPHAHSSHSPSSIASYTSSSTPPLSVSLSVSPYDPGLASIGIAQSYTAPLLPLPGGKGTKHRRQSSTGHRRRMSDARESLALRPPAFGPIPSTSPPPSVLSQSLPAPSNMRRRDKPPKEEKHTKEAGGQGKRIYTCEECHKVYRHRSCMDKHRWEHSPHWLPSSKFLLSKHQQVQLLEAAAILAHLPTAGAAPGAPARSLPDDRSEWPAYLAALRTDTHSRRMWGDGSSTAGTEDNDNEIDVLDVEGSVEGEGGEEDEETEDEIEVVRGGWEGVGGMEMEL